MLELKIEEFKRLKEVLDRESVKNGLTLHVVDPTEDERNLTLVTTSEDDEGLLVSLVASVLSKVTGKESPRDLFKKLATINEEEIEGTTVQEKVFEDVKVQGVFIYVTFGQKYSYTKHPSYSKANPQGYLVFVGDSPKKVYEKIGETLGIFYAFSYSSLKDLNQTLYPEGVIETIYA